jgi:hypothetical protein
LNFTIAPDSYGTFSFSSDLTTRVFFEVSNLREISAKIEKTLKVVGESFTGDFKGHGTMNARRERVVRQGLERKRDK